MQENAETLKTLMQRYSDIEKLSGVQRVKFADAVRTGEDPLNIVKYLATLGIEVKAPADLFRLNDDPDEEELVCFWIPEGVAAMISSDDLWLVFEVDHVGEPNDTATTASAGTDGSTRA
jgi:hypothetical protein